MKFAILSLVAVGALALTAGSADAQYRYGSPYRGGYYGPSYYRGGGFSNPGWSGTNFSITTPRGFGISFGSGGVYPSSGWNRSYYGGYGNRYYGGWNGYRPSYGGYGYGRGWRW